MSNVKIHGRPHEAVERDSLLNAIDALVSMREKYASVVTNLDKAIESLRSIVEPPAASPKVGRAASVDSGPDPQGGAGEMA